MIIKRNKEFSLKGTRMLAGFNKKILRKAPYQAKRSAIKTQNKVIGGVAKIKTSLEEAAMNPGGATRKITKTVIEKPLTTATVMAPVPGTTLAAPAVSKLEGRTTGKFTKKVAREIDNRLGPTLENGVNSLRYAIPV